MYQVRYICRTIEMFIQYSILKGKTKSTLHRVCSLMNSIKERVSFFSMHISETIQILPYTTTKEIFTVQELNIDFKGKDQKSEIVCHPEFNSGSLGLFLDAETSSA